MTEQIDEVLKHLTAGINYVDAAQKSLDGAIAEIQRAAMVLNVMDPGGAQPQITLYSQRDPAWAGKRLGTSNVTIGGYGCLMTCAASCLTDAGVSMNPDQLNTWLNQNSGYVSGNHFVFNAIDKLNAVKFVNLIECASVPAPVGQFDEWIKDGNFAIVKVDFNPATMQVEEHWVRYLGDGQMMDPWQGDIAPIVQRYRGRDAAQAILRAALYKRVTA